MLFTWHMPVPSLLEQITSCGCRWHVVQLGADLAVTLALVLFHSVVLICQFMTFSVAMNSKRSNAIIALLIASNFVEIKGDCIFLHLAL